MQTLICQSFQKNLANFNEKGFCLKNRSLYDHGYSYRNLNPTELKNLKNFLKYGFKQYLKNLKSDF